jgi:hypothetical protein
LLNSLVESKRLACLLMTDWQRERQALDYLYLTFSCCQLPFREFTKHNHTSLQVWMQMYCTFVLFLNQHFPGLPASGTHCIYIFRVAYSFPLLCLVLLQINQRQRDYRYVKLIGKKFIIHWVHKEGESHFQLSALRKRLKRFGRNPGTRKKREATTFQDCLKVNGQWSTDERWISTRTIKREWKPARNVSIIVDQQVNGQTGFVIAWTSKRVINDVCCWW